MCYVGFLPFCFFPTYLGLALEPSCTQQKILLFFRDLDNKGRQLDNVKTGTLRSLNGNSISVDQSFHPHHDESVHSVNV
jgi:hypothetical protein